MAKILTVLIVACGLQMSAFAQENSPYSRYGIGDLTPNHNVFTKGMGGISAGVSDGRSINFTNPASLSETFNTVFDVGTEIDYRTLKSTGAAKKFTSANTYVSYLQMAFPLSTRKMLKKNMLWAMSFGLKPVSKVNYKIETFGRLTTTTTNDSIRTLYEGTGGVNQAFLGTGLKIKGFSIGINAGYMFGSKDYSTKLSIINDSVYHYESNSAYNTNFGGLFINAGLQYDIPLKWDADHKKTIKNLKIGVYGNLQQKLRANRDQLNETIVYDASGNVYRVDSVYDIKGEKGNIILPAMGGAGFTYTDYHWLVGADFEYGNWTSYRSYGAKDLLQNNWTIRAGAQYFPAKENSPVKKYFSFVKYRAGIYYGTDYINTANKSRPEYGVTLGTGMPLTSLKRRSFDASFVTLNTALEFGSRGNKQTNLRENVVRFSLGISMSAQWFQKGKYN